VIQQTVDAMKETAGQQMMVLLDLCNASAVTVSHSNGNGNAVHVLNMSVHERDLVPPYLQQPQPPTKTSTTTATYGYGTPKSLLTL
jgi:hypothetical protein